MLLEHATAHARGTLIPPPQTGHKEKTSQSTLNGPHNVADDATAQIFAEFGCTS